MATDHRSRVLALLTLLLLVPAPSVGTLAAMWLWPGPVGQVVYGACKVWLLAFPLLWLRLVERGPWSWSPPRHGGLAVGTAIGTAIALVIVAGYVTVGRRWIDPNTVRHAAERSGLASAGMYLGLVGYLVLVNSLLEEYVWRWFVYRRCEILLPRGPAVVVAGLLFTVHHVVALRIQFPWRITLLGSAGVWVGGVLLSWLYQRYRSIWPAYACHAVIDVAVLGVGWVLLFG